MRLEACIADISTWMKINLLKLDQDKTELIIFAPKHRVKELGGPAPGDMSPLQTSEIAGSTVRN
jgi:hypothetical protein